jgi:hypothetical protein
MIQLYTGSVHTVKNKYDIIITMKDTLGLKGRYQIIKTCSLTGKVLYDSGWQDNLIMLGTNTGRDLILDKLNGDNTYTSNITYLDIGTSSTAPAVSDTNLVAGVARTDKASGVVSGNMVTFGFFFASANLANGTYREVATFVDGTSSLGTGQIFSRALFASNYVKGTNEDTTINWQYTLA